ncbi:MAG: hypothetical protein HC788_11180 [Sphingopyxis sp.]|nr:hypothetical protein [Sphingopyxis sp.]
MIKTSVQYAKDLYRQPFYQKLEKNLTWLWIYAAHMAGFFVAGCAAGLLINNFAPLAALQFGLSVLVWGVFVRVALTVHGHWLVGYFAHNRGPQSWQVADAGVQAHDVPWAGLITMGEAWHNNHHAFPGSANAGLGPWRMDIAWSASSTGLPVRSCHLRRLAATSSPTSASGPPSGTCWPSAASV